MRQVGSFVHRDFQTTWPYAGVNQVREKLISHSALVVLDEDTADYVGVLTPRDIVQRQHNLVIDCLTHKPMLQCECNIEEALETMHRQHTEVLPLENRKKFEGLIFKNDLVSFLSSQKTEQGEQLLQHGEEIKNSKKILNAIYNSTHSVRFLVAPDYTILFFNKTATENTILLHGKKLRIGDNFMDRAKDILNTTDGNLKSDFETALQGEFVARENEIRHAGGSFWFKTEYNPVYADGELIGISISSRDISGRKKNELFIKKKNKVLKDIIFSQSHEVRRPVASILGIISCFDKSGLSENNKKLMDFLDVATQELDSAIKAVVLKAYNNSREGEIKIIRDK